MTSSPVALFRSRERCPCDPRAPVASRSSINARACELSPGYVLAGFWCRDWRPRRLQRPKAPGGVSSEPKVSEAGTFLSHIFFTLFGFPITEEWSWGDQSLQVRIVSKRSPLCRRYTANLFWLEMPLFAVCNHPQSGRANENGGSRYDPRPLFKRELTVSHLIYPSQRHWAGRHCSSIFLKGKTDRWGNLIQVGRYSTSRGRGRASDPETHKFLAAIPELVGFWESLYKANVQRKALFSFMMNFWGSKVDIPYPSQIVNVDATT